MLGTAFPAARILLVEQPGPWGRAGLPASRFDVIVAHALIARLNRRGVRVVAIRRPGRTVPDGLRRWCSVDCRPGRESAVWGRFDADHELLAIDPDRLPAATTEREPFFAVCVHGTHDVCCAMQGRPVAAALEQVRPGRAWECSHIGGDRFAANVLVLPTGVLYGRVDADDAERLVAAAEAGLVLGDRLRGRVGLPPEAQAAIAAVLAERPGTPLDAVTAGPVRAAGADDVGVRIRVAAEEFDVAVRRVHADPEWLTCQSAAPGRATDYVPTSVTRLPT